MVIFKFVPAIEDKNSEGIFRHYTTPEIELSRRFVFFFKSESALGGSDLQTHIGIYAYYENRICDSSYPNHA